MSKKPTMLNQLTDYIKEKHPNQSNESIQAFIKEYEDLPNFNEVTNQILNNTKIKVNENAKDNHAEVSTPSWLVDEMLSTLPSTFFQSPKLVLDPCVGSSGIFTDTIIERFTSNGIKREKVIKDCLFYADINPMNIFISRIKYGIDSNYFQQDALKIEFTDRFDLVTTNPPYNHPFNKNSKASSPLYHTFIEKFIPQTRYLLFVVPSRWFAGGRGLTKFRTMMLARDDIVMIKNYPNSKDIFKNVDIKGGINYFLIDEKYKGLTKFIENDEEIEMKLNEHDIVVHPKYNDLIKLVDKHGSLADLYQPSGYYGIQTNDKRLQDNDDDNLVKCYVSKLKGFVKYIHKDHIKKQSNKFKVITPRGSGKGKDGFGNIFIGTPEEVCSQTYIFFETNTRKEVESLLSYMKCKLPNLMLSLRKITQHMCKDTIKWIPMVPLDRTWNDDSVNEYFDIDT